MSREEELRVRVRSKGIVDVTRLKELVLEGERLTTTDFSGQTLDHFVAIDCTFKACRFESMRIEYACFGSGWQTSCYEDCSFNGTTIVASSPGYSEFVRCSFMNVSISEFFGLNVSMVDCRFSGKLHKVVFYGANPTRRRWFWTRRNAFRGNEFSQARFGDVAFREHIDLSKQKLPHDWVPGKDPYKDVT
jgi:hypothetical protein